jgi:chitin disaccharide deacetylase
VRRLIINADDFGLTNGINRAIVDAHKSGVVTSATLMASGPACGAAVALATTSPDLSVGSHVVLVDGTPVCDSAQIPSLVDDSASSPSFRNSLGGLAARAIARRIDPEHVEREATAQIRTLQAKGIVVSHFDTHKHTHVFPWLLDPLLRAAKACGVGAVRNPFGLRLPCSLRDFTRRPNLWKRFIEVRILSVFASSFPHRVAKFGMRTTDGSFGVVATGALDLALFDAMVEAIPEGTWEFVCHPGHNDAELASVRTRLRDSREKELAVLTSPLAREALERRGIQLISYRDL